MGERQDAYSVELGGLGADLLVAPDESESGVAVVEHTLRPGALGAPVHRHSREDELSYVLAGTLGLYQGGTESTVAAGETVVKPRDTWHTFWNPGPDPVRFLEVIAPGGFADYFPAVADALDAGMSEEERTAALGEIAGRYGLEFDFEATGEVLARHDLEM